MRILHVTTTDISLELLLGDQLSSFVELGYEVHAASAPGPYVPAIQDRGVTFHPLNSSTRSWSITADLRAARELLSVVRQVRPDVLHTHNPKPGLYGRVVGSLVPGVCTVNTVHGLYAQNGDSMVRRAAIYGLERAAAGFSRAEFFQNSEDLDTYRRLGVPAKRLHLIGNGVDLAKFRPPETDEERARARLDLGVEDESTIIFGCVSRLVGEKGIYDLLDAFKIVSPKNSVVLALVGPSDHARSDGLTAEELAVAERDGTRIVGFRDDVDHLYRGMDILVSASYREGYPRTVMEASASGCAILATDIRGTRDAVKHRETAHLVPPGDVAELATTIEMLADEAEYRRRLAVAARRNAMASFDYHKQVRLIDGTYRQLLGPTVVPERVTA